MHSAGSDAKLAPATAATSSAPATVSTTARAASRTQQGTQASGLAGTLAFQSSQGGTIYAYDLTTGNLRSLTTGYDPAISPDGQTVAFTRPGVYGGLFLIDSDGSNERSLYTGAVDMASPKWRADGGAISFNYVVSSTNCRDMGGGQCTPEIAFQEDKRLADLDMDDYAPFTEYEYDIGIVNADGSNFHSLSALHSSRTPDWGGAGIVYQSSDGIQLTQDVAGAASQVLAYEMLKPRDEDPDMQDNGSRVVFQRKSATHYEIYVMNGDGSGQTALTQPQTTLVDALPSNVAPAWSPDGQHIVFLSNRTDNGNAGAWRLWVMDADGSNQRVLAVDVPIQYTFGSEQVVSWGM